MAIILRNGELITVPDVHVFGPEQTDAERLLATRKQSHPVTRAQFATALAVMEIITMQEAKNFAGGNNLPEFATDAINSSNMTDIEKMAAEIKALSALTMHRLNPIVQLMQVALSLSDKDVDSLFTLATTFG